LLFFLYTTNLEKITAHSAAVKVVGEKVPLCLDGLPDKFASLWKSARHRLEHTQFVLAAEHHVRHGKVHQFRADRLIGEEAHSV